jgi:Fe-S-cluster containining protein
MTKSTTAHGLAPIFDDLGRPQTQRAVVPCGTCHLCCVNSLVLLFPDAGDKVETYDTVPFGNEYRALRRLPGGRCVYLDPAGRCSIWERAPAVCKAFDCRLAYLKHTRAERRRLVKDCHASPDLFAAGRARLDTLPATPAAERRPTWKTPALPGPTAP